MNRTNEKDFWIEMSIREIWTQAHFAQISFNNIDSKATLTTDLVFSSIHSFLSHCANVSKLLKAENDELPKIIIGDIISVPKKSVIHDRTFRNHLEHYDERLKKWIREKGLNSAIGTYNIGPKSAFNVEGMVLVSHYDDTTKIFTFVDEDVNLTDLYNEVTDIKLKADNWVKALSSPQF